MAFFGFFKGKKESTRIPKFDKKLIKKFHHDHKKLVSRITSIQDALKLGEDTKVKSELIYLKMDILGHFMEEDIKLYWYLKNYYKNEEGVSDMINTFSKSIKVIQKDVMKFLDYYAQDEIVLDVKFKNEFDLIVTKLSSRIESEESSLYTLYEE